MVGSRLAQVPACRHELQTPDMQTWLQTAAGGAEPGDWLKTGLSLSFQALNMKAWLQAAAGGAEPGGRLLLQLPHQAGLHRLRHFDRAGQGVRQPRGHRLRPRGPSHRSLQTPGPPQAICNRSKTHRFWKCKLMVLNIMYITSDRHDKISNIGSHCRFLALLERYSRAIGSDPVPLPQPSDAG